MDRLTKHWNNLPENKRNTLLFIAVILAALIATVALLEDSGVKAVLYQAF